MANTTVVTANELIKFQSDYFKAYLRKSGLTPFMGQGMDKVIKTYSDLNDEGKELNVPIVYPVKNTGVGTGQLAGNEASIANNSMRIRPVWRRNAVTVKKSEQKKASIDLYRAQREALREWSTWDLKYRLNDALSVVAYDETAYNEEDGVETWVPYAAATATQRNNFITANLDRVWFGGSATNEVVTGNFAGSLSNVASAERLSRGHIDSIKALAMTESRTDSLVNALRPMAFGDDGVEKFVMFCPTVAFNHLKADLETVNQNARPRGVDNIIFSGGVLEYNGVLVVELPELPRLTGVGASSADVAPSYFCGAQALAMAWGQMPRFTKDTNNDYDFINNVGIEEQRGIAKVMFGNRQHGIVSVFTGI
ncbi:MAG: DUF4043 family protein [Rhodocyclaceae bacterium]|nr:DUF4043 family protein [Rhodocyclaceae bacterium]